MLPAKTAISAALLVLATAACGRDSAGPSLALDVRFAQIDRSVIPHPPTVVREEAGSIRLSGSFGSSCADDQLRGQATLRNASSIHIRIWAHRNSGSCTTMTSALYGYTGAIHDIDPGTYTVTVEHERDARRPDGVVATATVVVL